MPAPASAQDSSVPFLLSNWFVRNCDSSTWRVGCAAYVLGYYQGTQTREKTVCLPEGVDAGQLYEIALAYMREHPEKGHIVGMALMDEAWVAAFPCRNG
ncbi:Rap1a/Tai family immunity protein [Aurantiacibacter rhizosphaerae]|uniref:Rap1a/Tai family immunity protein n=1 Tax=Aurantiacibacter rhizosphaerae TaxID=2691582 RepID=UPI003B020305